ncbi:hypothetical protein BDW27_105193 [Nocardiopsis sp. L17-MgMaSL7]|nr:hypothetical protein BDW27_105193 [Nocardiopsis sp. L17-MgMaSL7]
MHRQPNEQSTGESEPVVIAAESSEGLVILLPDSDDFHSGCTRTDSTPLSTSSPPQNYDPLPYCLDVAPRKPAM